MDYSNKNNVYYNGGAVYGGQGNGYNGGAQYQRVDMTQVLAMQGLVLDNYPPAARQSISAFPTDEEYAAAGYGGHDAYSPVLAGAENANVRSARYSVGSAQDEASYNVDTPGLSTSVAHVGPYRRGSVLFDNNPFSSELPDLDYDDACSLTSEDFDNPSLDIKANMSRAQLVAEMVSTAFETGYEAGREDHATEQCNPPNGGENTVTINYPPNTTICVDVTLDDGDGAGRHLTTNDRVASWIEHNPHGVVGDADVAIAHQATDAESKGMNDQSTTGKGTATHRAALTQASPWLDRYSWVDTDMTVYNGPLPTGTVGRQLHGRSDAAQVAAVIVGIANTYDLRDSCAAGYRVAQWLYGDRCVNSSVRLDCGPQTLFHEIENSVNRNTMPQMCWALSSNQLALASQFIGYANAEYMRDLARSTVVHGLRVRDAHVMRRALSNIDVHALETIVDRYIAGQTLLPDLPVDFAHYVRLGLRRGWVETGVVHNLALGRAVGASISGSCVERLEMPDQAMLSETDVLAYGSAHARAEATAWLVNELIRNGGENLCASLDEAVPKSGATTQMHVDCSYYMGMTLQFMVVGFGNDMVLKYHRPVNFVFTPTVDQVRSDRDDQARVPEVQPMTDIDNELAQESARTRVETADDIMRDVMAIRGSKQSTLFQRGPTVPVVAKPQFDEGTVVVTSPSDDVIAAVQELAERGVGPGHTSGEGALCGANALHMALQVVEDTHELTVEALNEMLRDAVRETVTTEDLGENATNWYSEVQLAAVSRELGYNLTVVEGKGKGTAVAYSTTDVPGAKHLIVFQLTPGHWEGPSTSNAHTRVRVSGRASGTPRVEHARTAGRSAFRRVLQRGENT